MKIVIGLLAFSLAGCPEDTNPPDGSVVDTGPADRGLAKDADPGDADDVGFAQDAAEPDALAMDAMEVDAAEADAAEADAAEADAAEGDASNCQWIHVTICNTGMPINQFCPMGQTVSQMRRCPDNTTFVPDQQYQMFPLAQCPDEGCTLDPNHVVWREVECCF